MPMLSPLGERRQLGWNLQRQLASRPLLTSAPGYPLPDGRADSVRRMVSGRFRRGNRAETVTQLLQQQHREMEQLVHQFEALRAAQEPVPTPSYLFMTGALPTHAVTAEELEAFPEELKSCTICIEDFREGDVQRTLPCFHRFHSHCVDRWLQEHGTCPICKIVWTAPGSNEHRISNKMRHYREHA